MCDGVLGSKVTASAAALAKRRPKKKDEGRVSFQLQGTGGAAATSLTPSACSGPVQLGIAAVAAASFKWETCPFITAAPQQTLTCEAAQLTGRRGNHKAAAHFFFVSFGFPPLIQQ
ncbi:hypothetical protein TraAM80_09881 [Trypanosoma rangeli]|uniref:Uncharacterized protein n=1 Tax=Trypanosoma rangeli TaxID=5698 RepID=A0A422MSR6_TRYRA|nr:uncharacterized protein TraAM80_09881 [Trypanosoma rangeli]RNE96268.1 hypothetical protein TraAM80_09881 [Trypanosoma rangeli]|eukprot:RNE96268.1 hypothetical protein TraAM80_09881 [Trypanosoma rangeli]